jgi:hypothetical protein
MMKRYIAEHNIQHFKEKLAEERDPAKRKILLQLLAEEEAKLAAMPAAKPKDEKDGKR